VVQHYVTILRIGLAVAALGGIACAADRGSMEERRACTPDVLKHCSEFIPDPVRITACLQEKLRELSPDCRIVIGSRKQ
jgi:hypothetical protein